MDEAFCDLLLALFFVVAEEVGWKDHFSARDGGYSGSTADGFVDFAIFVLAPRYVIRN